MNPSASGLESVLEALQGSPTESSDMAESLMALISRKNREAALRFLSTPYAQRMVLLPQCLRSTSACQAEERDAEYLCRECGACKIAAILARARELGYMSVKILKGGSALMRIVEETKPKAALGVACFMEGVMGILACERAGVPAFCVPLLRGGCSDTDVDLNDVLCVLEAVLP